MLMPMTLLVTEGCHADANDNVNQTDNSMLTRAVFSKKHMSPPTAATHISKVCAY